MKKCPKCGTECTDDLKTCSECGNSLDVTQEPKRKNIFKIIMFIRIMVQHYPFYIDTFLTNVL